MQYSPNSIVKVKKAKCVCLNKKMLSYKHRTAPQFRQKKEKYLERESKKSKKRKRSDTTTGGRPVRNKP